MFVCVFMCVFVCIFSLATSSFCSDGVVGGGMGTTQPQKNEIRWEMIGVVGTRTPHRLYTFSFSDGPSCVSACVCGDVVVVFFFPIHVDLKKK